MRNILLVISGPSGVGKGTMKDRLMRGGDYAFSVSCTTRHPRVGEQDGVDYFFLTRDAFEGKIAEGEFLEYDEHFGYYYGTPRTFVEEKLREESVLLDVDVVGALNVKKRYPDAVLVMLVPPYLEALAARLRGRGSETEEERRNRLARAEYELSLRDKFDYVVVNDDPDLAEQEIRRIASEEKNRT